MCRYIKRYNIVFCADSVELGRKMATMAVKNQKPKAAAYARIC
jgi:hypothetical protein